jgi:fumarylacetoacetate (FAA) hydrolase
VKLASLKEGGRDGTLVIVSRDLKRASKVADIARNLQQALDYWSRVEGDLRRAAKRLHEIQFDPIGAGRSLDLNPDRLAAPLPRAFQLFGGNAYLRHVQLVRQARGASMPQEYFAAPLMYQGRSDGFYAPTEDLVFSDEGAGIDFEAEIAVIVDDVPAGIDRGAVGAHIRLIMLANDVSLRNLIPDELAKGYGYLHGKPGLSFSPVAVTPDELGPYWDGGKISLPLASHLNGRLFGNPNAGVDMDFDFPALIAHAAKTRPLVAGTIIASGAVSNKDARVGSSCIAELRTLETILGGRASTPFLKFGDRLRIEMVDGDGRSVFGAIDHRIRRAGDDG